MNREATPEERQTFVVEKLAEQGRISTVEISAHFEVSEDTARRDLREMASAGLVQRVHGGALPVSPAGQPFTNRYRIAGDEKVRLARRAGQLILPGQLVIMDGGTTNLELARNLPHDLAATIVTNSPRIAIETSEHPCLEVILIGGVFDKRSQMTLGAHVLNELSMFKADICFLGVHGIHAEFGLTTTGYDEGTIKKAMMNASAEVVALVMANKFGTGASHKFAMTADLNVIVADDTAVAKQFTQEMSDNTRLVFA